MTFDKVTGFDEKIVHYGEDLDMGVRLENAGMKLFYDSELIVTHLHIRGLNDALTTAFEYGYKSLPQLVKLHPSLASQLRLDWLEGGSIIRVLKGILLSNLVYLPMLTLANILNEFAAPSILYSYLIFRNYFKGYTMHEEAQNRGR